jgi:hypothetical protein
LARHDRIIEAAVERYGGVVVRPRGEGDSRFAVFARASDGVASATAIQQGLQAEGWPTQTPVRVRLALHTGEADLWEGDYYGRTVNRCARLRAIAHGGQALISQATYELVQDDLPPGISLRDLGQYRLKDLQRPERVFQLVAPGIASEFPPLQHGITSTTAGMPRRKTLLSLPAPSALAPVAPFVGRAQDLEALVGFLVSQGPPLRLLVGEPGIGKTRLLRKAAEHAVAYGFTVLFGGCYRHGGQEPYAPLLEALERHIQGHAPAHLPTALEGCGWLVRILPELADAPLPPSRAILPPEQERRLMFRAVRRYMANVAGPAGTLLVLDDLQWAGSDALDLLMSLIRAAPVPPLRVLAAYRDTDVDAQDPLGLLLADLAHAGLATQQALHPLPPQEAAQLLQKLLMNMRERGHGLEERVLQRAGGVPFFLVSYAQSLVGAAKVGTAALAVPTMPWDIGQGVRQRVAALSEGARAVLRVVAVVGQRVRRALLVDVVGQPEEEVYASLDEACWTRLLLQDGDTYQFTYDVIQEVVEDDLGAVLSNSVVG